MQQPAIKRHFYKTVKKWKLLGIVAKYIKHRDLVINENEALLLTMAKMDISLGKNVFLKTAEVNA